MEVGNEGKIERAEVVEKRVVADDSQGGAAGSKSGSERVRLRVRVGVGASDQDCVFADAFERVAHGRPKLSGKRHGNW